MENEHQTIRGSFSEIYYSALNQILSLDEIKQLSVIFSSLNKLLILLSILALTKISLNNVFDSVIYGVMFLVVLECAFYVAYLLPKIVTSGTKFPSMMLNEILAQFLIGTHNPLTDKAGLDIQGLQKLKRIGEIDQSSADWRGGFTSILVVGVIGFAVWGGTSSATWFMQNFVAEISFRNINENYFASNWLSLLALLFFWLVVSRIIFLAFSKLALYTESFLGTESANRTILLACEDGINLLEAHGWQKNKNLNLNQKEKLAVEMGFTLQEVRKDSSPKWFTSFIQDNRKWILWKGTKSKTNRVRITSVMWGAGLTNEYVRIENSGYIPVNMNGWVLRGGTGNKFVFPLFYLRPHSAVVIWSKAGKNDIRNLHWGRKEELLYQGFAYLEDNKGSLISSLITKNVQEPSFQDDPKVVVIRIKHISFNPSGQDVKREFVLIENSGMEKVDLTDWSLSDKVGHAFVFPKGFVLEPNNYVTLWAGSGKDTPTDLHWKRRKAIWNNSGDTAYLKDKNGKLIDTYQYSSN